MIRISVNLDNPLLAGKDPKKIRFVLSPLAGNFFIPRAHPPLNTSSSRVGDAGVSVARWLEVGGSTPLYIEDADFVLLGNGDGDPFMGMRNKASLVDMMRKALIIVERDGTPLTPEQVISYSV